MKDIAQLARPNAANKYKLVYQLSVDEGNRFDAVPKETIADVSSVSPSSEQISRVIRSDKGLAILSSMVSITLINSQ